MVSFLSSAQWLRPKKINYSNLFHENLINGKQVSLWNKNNKQKKYIYFKILVWNLVWILHFLSVFLFPSFFQLTFTFRGIWWHFEKRRKVRCFFRHGCVQQHFFLQEFSKAFCKMFTEKFSPDYHKLRKDKSSSVVSLQCQIIPYHPKWSRHIMRAVSQKTSQLLGEG